MVGLRECRPKAARDFNNSRDVRELTHQGITEFAESETRIYTRTGKCWARPGPGLSGLGLAGRVGAGTIGQKSACRARPLVFDFQTAEKTFLDDPSKERA